MTSTTNAINGQPRTELTMTQKLITSHRALGPAQGWSPALRSMDLPLKRNGVRTESELRCIVQEQR